MFRPGILLHLLCLYALGFGHAAGAQQTGAPTPEISSVAVGFPDWKRDLVIEGTEVELAPANNSTLIVLRIADVYPHGSAFRYDIEYYGLEAGAYNLLDYLKRKDGSSLEGTAPIPVVIESNLPAGTLRPNALESGEVPSVGGYALRMTIYGVLWGLGLWAIWALGRKRAPSAESVATRPQTLAERLRPLVEQGLAGKLSAEDSAQLELSLIAFWRRKLDLQNQPSAQALQQLKGHDEAGPLLRQLELWLHSPDKSEHVDPAELLAPYQHLKADEFEAAVGFNATEQPRSSD
ncbi:MAG: hypothetical protein ACI8TQ_000406 [Planctomycetota bacterium]|jgi:hypothetical protein